MAVISKKIPISNRLKEVASFIDFSLATLDIGSDHCYLPIYLISKRFLSKMFASENKSGPYNKMLESVKEYGVESKINILYGNGLDVYKDEIKQVSICGMGGDTIASIIESMPDVYRIDRFILEPQSNYELVRLTMARLGYKEINEKYIKEKNKYYPIISYEKGIEQINSIEAKYGKIALKNKDANLKKFLQKKLSELMLIKDKNSIRNNDEIFAKIEELSTILNLF